jgi:hypothetical protein
MGLEYVIFAVLKEREAMKMNNNVDDIFLKILLEYSLPFVNRVLFCRISLLFTGLPDHGQNQTVMIYLCC